MEIAEILDEIKKKAQEDADLKEELLRTREQKNPLSAFCAKCCELGYPVYEMDVIAAGEESYAAMRRSTNGGGEKSPMLEAQEDYYELLIAGQ
ncbi:MAG: hypothetical protein LIO96_04610 [Lachnospiraceae bacterium]|nr:hypothetical protein [Lachnospiraceae bacterium]